MAMALSDDLPGQDPLEQSLPGAESLLRDTVEPIGLRVVIRKDENRRVSSGGIALPDKTEIPVITGRIVAISEQVRNDPEIPLREFDKVLFNPKEAIPVDFENDKLFVVAIENVVAVFRRQPRRPSNLEG